ncbi:polymorphic toxin-type HINT domain-containing protein, partial [Paludisphaera rhizosphaerae]|uniref:polymorphic toxin-type HINT domain-containing protein n=1 Tax=Paludisphaera rhizosphaerae TaxID=2711216 RepID=UPI00197F29D5
VSDVLGPGDRIHYNEYGERVVDRLVGTVLGPRTPTMWIAGTLPYFGGSINGPAAGIFTSQPVMTPAATEQTLGRLFTAAGMPATQGAALSRQMATPPPGLSSNSPFIARPTAGINANPVINEYISVPVDRMAEEARISAAVARDQLAADVAWIEAYNTPIREVNERSVAVLKEASGRDLGADRDRWMDWLIDLQGYGQPLRGDTSPPATIVEEVPIAYQPQTSPVPITEMVALYRIGPSCFAGGTPVRTIQGDRPIETIRPGDLVLSQDTTTGRLSYQPVVEVMHNPPNWTYKIDLGGGEAVHPTGIHRFWKAGHGWIMAREIKAGDKLRTVGGVVEVVSAEKEKVQPVFNLLLSGGDNYCVGGLGLVAHDNGFVEPVAQPFDGVPATAELVA